MLYSYFSKHNIFPGTVQGVASVFQRLLPTKCFQSLTLRAPRVSETQWDFMCIIPAGSHSKFLYANCGDWVQIVLKLLFTGSLTSASAHACACMHLPPLPHTVSLPPIFPCVLLPNYSVPLAGLRILKLFGTNVDQ